MIYSNRCIQSKQPRMIKTAIYNDIFTSLRCKKNQSQAKQFKELFSLCSNHFQWNGIVICEVWPCLFSISAWTDTQKAVLFTVFSLLKLFFSCCIVVAVAKENLLKTPAIILLANFHCSQILQHLRLSFDWLFGVCLIIDQSECLVCYFLCTELTLFCIELPENCICLNQSELSNFFF